MKLYYAPGACSLSPHIVLREAGLPFELEKIDNKAKTTASGEDYFGINPKGYVPALKLDDGSVLTEGPVIVQYVADHAPASKLAPAAGTMERYRVGEWLNFITSELHKNYGTLFNPGVNDESKQAVRQRLAQRYGFVEKELAKKPFLTGDSFSVTDAYLFTVTRWANAVKLDMTALPHVVEFMKRVGARPAVKEAMTVEGLPLVA
jgi:glutathione S-transferase